MKGKEKNQTPKGCAGVIGIIIIVFAIYAAVKFVTWIKSPSEIVKTDYLQEWSAMTYEERDSFLVKAIENRSFVNDSEAEWVMREAIKKEVINPKTVNFTVSPSIYNGLANVIEADSGWIHVSFWCTAKNDFGIEKEIAGSVMYLYKPETNSLEVKKWDINQNN